MVMLYEDENGNKYLWLVENYSEVMLGGEDKSYDDFEVSDECEWMRDNAYKYGFILRYPKGKENITGFNYAPWHYRYVGKEVAKTIYEKNIVLEEY